MKSKLSLSSDIWKMCISRREIYSVSVFLERGIKRHLPSFVSAFSPEYMLELSMELEELSYTWTPLLVNSIRIYDV